MPVALYGGKYSRPFDVSGKAEKQKSFYFVSQSSFAPHIQSCSDAHNVHLIDRCANKYHTTISSFRLHLHFENAALLFHFFHLHPLFPPLISQGHFSKLCLFKALDHFNLISPEMRRGKKTYWQYTIWCPTISYLERNAALYKTCVCARMWCLCQCSHEKHSYFTRYSARGI